MFKKFKMLIELVNKEETENGGIGVTESVKLMREIGAVAKKHKFDCYAKGYSKEVIDYVPTGKTYELRTLEDIANLTEDQFEMMIDDLRSWCNLQRELKNGRDFLETIGISVDSKELIIWIDSGLHEKKVEVSITSTNKIA